MQIFICNLHLVRVYYKLTMCQLQDGVIAQLIEHRPGIAKIIGSNLVQV